MTDALSVAGAVLLVLPEKILYKNTERLLPLVLRQYLHGRIEVSKKFHPVQDKQCHPDVTLFLSLPQCLVVSLPS